MRALTIVSALGLLAFTGTAAAAGELVVIEAHGVRGMAAGKTIDGSKPLSLEDGQELTLLTASGQVIKLEGPSEAAPEAGLQGGGAGDVKTAMAALITERKVRTSEVGVVRGQEVKLPDPWVVDVTHPGTTCVQAGKPVVLWRGGSLSATRVDFAPKDRSWNISGNWPAAADRLSLPATMPLKDNFDYVVALGSNLAPVTVRLIPPAVNNDAMRAGYMIEAGCENQLNALLAAYSK